MAIWSDILYKLKDILTSIGTNGTLIDESLQDVQANQVLQLNRTSTGYVAPHAYTLVEGTLISGTLDNAKHQDRTYMVIGEVGAGLEIIFDFTLPSGQVMRRIKFNGQYIGGDGHKVDVYIYNYDTAIWDEISTNNFKDILPTENDIEITWDMDNDGYVDTDGSLRIKFNHIGGGDESHSLKIDCISCGDYKSPQLLADIGSKLDDIKILTDRGYIELQAEGTKTQYDLPDPRVKLANTNDIRCIGDLTDDADFKGINIPIVEGFNEFPATPVSQRLRIFSEVPRKNLFLPQMWSDVTYALTYGKNRSFSEMDDKRILETIIIFPTTVTDTLRVAWRIIPENATQTDFANTPFAIQELSQQGMTLAADRIAIVNGETDIQFMKTAYSDGRLWIGIEWVETAVRYNGLYTIAFNKDQGFSFIANIVAKSSIVYMKGISLTKGKGGDVFFIKQSATSVTIYRNEGSVIMSYLFGNTYPGFSAIEGTGILSTAYLGDDTDDTLLIAFAFDASTMVVYKVPWVSGSNINPPLADVTINGIYMSSSANRIVDMFSLNTGEVQISYYDDDEGDQSELSNTSFGDTGSYTLYYDTHARYNFISTDKHYMINPSSTQGSFSTYYITPRDLSIFAAAIISYDDLNITFSNALVSGSKFYIMKYISDEFIIKNEITYDEDGQAIRKPFLTKDTIYNTSDIQINPSTEEKQDSIITSLNTKDYFTEVSLGNVPGQSVQVKFGTNSAVGASNEVIWDNGNGYNWLGGATLLNFTSDNVNDTSAGSGARTLKIFGLDANYDLQEETIILTGQTIKQSANTYIRLYRAIVMTEGETADANTGTLYCFTGTETGGVPDDSTKIYMAMRPTLGQTLMAVYTVPAGKTAVLRSAWITAGGDKVVTGQLFVRPFGGAKNLKMDVDILNYLFFRPFSISQLFAEKTDIWIEGKVDVASFKLSAGFDLLLIDN